jgi:hypothetical protein
VNGEIYRGVLTGCNEAFVIDKKSEKSWLLRIKKAQKSSSLFL